MKKTYTHSTFAKRRVLSNGSFVTFAIALAVFLLVGPASALAAAAANFGDMLCNSITRGFGPMPDLLEAGGYIIGTAFLVQGLFMLNKFNDNPQGQPLHQPLTRIGGGAFLLALPSATTALIDTFFRVSGGGGITACVPGVVTAGGTPDLSVLLTNLVGNVKDPITDLVSDAAIVFGVFMVVRGLIKASKYGIDPHEHSMPKILANLIVGAILMVVGQTFTSMLDTLFGAAGVASSTDVKAWPIMGATELNASPEFIQAVQDAGIFMELIGMIAFVRGWLIIKSASEGRGQATMAQGITHMLGGVITMNVFGFLELMDATFGTGFL